jgi:proteasome assembly chaperone (PAC2) family protein
VNDDEPLQVTSLPELRDPVLLAAFSGWNDASQVATHSLTTLVNRWKAERFAQIDSELFFDFTEVRPAISIGPDGQRSLHWPANQFFSHQLAQNQHDVVLLVGTEPQLRWRSFCRCVLDLADRVGASALITLGGLLADVPHTVEPRLTGFASAPDLVPRLRKLGVRLSSYQGPTGIVGALHDAWRTTDRAALSLWGNVPHYISAAPNPQISLALLRRVGGILGIALPLSELEEQAKAFGAQIDEALVDNPEALEYVRQLEEQLSTEETPAQDAPELMDELEQFLRSSRPSPDESSED